MISPTLFQSSIKFSSLLVFRCRTLFMKRYFSFWFALGVLLFLILCLSFIDFSRNCVSQWLIFQSQISVKRFFIVWCYQPGNFNECWSKLLSKFKSMFKSTAMRKTEGWKGPRQGHPWKQAKNRMEHDRRPRPRAHPDSPAVHHNAPDGHLTPQPVGYLLPKLQHLYSCQI